MKTKKIAAGVYEIEYANKIFNIDNIETQFGWEWIVHEVVQNNDYKENVWWNTLDTLKDCKEYIKENN